jgi:hypothetical protein
MNLCPGSDQDDVKGFKEMKYLAQTKRRRAKEKYEVIRMNKREIERCFTGNLIEAMIWNMSRKRFWQER